VEQLYEEAEEKHLLEQVEPHTTSLMYKMGRTIYFSKGNQTNIKITTSEDLELFEGYVLMKQKREM
jgi:2-C-methyl-D-erythritol 4-phosphate cytidylyltransferase